jgi:hypothetical protein
MGGKNKGGRETRKPKQEQNKKAKGQTPPSGSVADGKPLPGQHGRSPRS